MSSVKSQLIGYGIAIGVGLVAFLYLKKKAGDAAAAVGQAVNPLDSKNVVNRTVDKIGEVVTGSKPGEWSLGSQIFRWLNPDVHADNFNAKNTSVIGSDARGYASDDYRKWVENNKEGIS